jgi:hypothetical protein
LNSLSVALELNPTPTSLLLNFLMTNLFGGPNHPQSPGRNGRGLVDVHILGLADQRGARLVERPGRKLLLRPRTYLRVHGVEGAARTSVERVVYLHALFRSPTVNALLPQFGDLLDVPDGTAP